MADKVSEIDWTRRTDAQQWPFKQIGDWWQGLQYKRSREPEKVVAPKQEKYTEKERRYMRMRDAIKEGNVEEFQKVYGEMSNQEYLGVQKQLNENEGITDNQIMAVWNKKNKTTESSEQPTEGFEYPEDETTPAAPEKKQGASTPYTQEPAKATKEGLSYLMDENQRGIQAESTPKILHKFEPVKTGQTRSIQKGLTVYQKSLVDLGFLAEEIDGENQIDSRYGKNTKTAVEKFQKLYKDDYGLTVTGDIDDKTANAIKTVAGI